MIFGAERVTYRHVQLDEDRDGVVFLAMLALGALWALIEVLS